MSRLIIIVLALAIVLGFLFWRFGPSGQDNTNPENRQLNLTVWGLSPQDNQLKVALDNYSKEHPNISFNFTAQLLPNYISRAQTQIDANQGPDVLVIHNAWLPNFLSKNELAPAPVEVISLNDLSRNFYPVVKDSLTANNKIYALPRGVDGLVLYYNEDILKAAGVSVPQTWDQFVSEAVKMTVTEQNGNIKTSGAALGAVNNISHFGDILGLLFIQNPGSNLASPNNSAGLEVIKFYTSFVTNPNTKTWDPNLGNDLEMFAQNKLAFYFGTLDDIDKLVKLNPNLAYKTAPVPQLPGQTKNWATFWAYAVSNKSKYPKEAWQVVKYLTDVNQQKLLFQETVNQNLTPVPYSQISLQNDLADDPLLGSFVLQGPSYEYGFLSANTQDQALNDRMVKVYQEAISSILTGNEASAALETASAQITTILQDYNLVPKPSNSN